MPRVCELLGRNLTLAPYQPKNHRLVRKASYSLVDPRPSKIPALTSLYLPTFKPTFTFPSLPPLNLGTSEGLLQGTEKLAIAPVAAPPVTTTAAAASVAVTAPEPQAPPLVQEESSMSSMPSVFCIDSLSLDSTTTTATNGEMCSSSSMCTLLPAALPFMQSDIIDDDDDCLLLDDAPSFDMEAVCPTEFLGDFMEEDIDFLRRIVGHPDDINRIASVFDDHNSHITPMH